MKVDLILKNAKVFNSFYKKFVDANVAVLDGKIFHIDKTKGEVFECDNEIECENKYLIPGLIDIHMHIESSMTTPEIFTNHIKKFGVTTIVAEPHEIANIAGIESITEFLNSNSECEVDVFYGIPSSVPSTNVNLETTGAILNYDDMVKISELDNVICVGEVMNYRGVIKDNTLEIVKFLEYVRNERKDLVIEGHCPKLTGVDLSKFLFLGIDGDHTEHNLDEIIEHFENGMFVELQEKMLKEEVLNHIVENNLYEHMSFVTDDVMPDYLLEGQLDSVVRKAIQKGFPVNEAIYCATTTPAKRMKLHDRGAIAVSKIADMVLLDDLETLKVSKTFKDGKVIYDKSNEQEIKRANYRFSKEICNSVKVRELTEEDFIIKTDKIGKVTCRVMEINDGGTFTKEVIKEFDVVDGKIDFENSDCVMVAVFERYGKNSSVGIGLATGDIIKKGAVATTYAHDCHNLLVVGKNATDMVKVANSVITNNGGLSTCYNGELKTEVKLNIGGILSDAPMSVLGEEIRLFRESLIELGYKHYNPIMSLCTLTLPVSPNLKITDKGLIDVKEGKIVDLIME
ncbi:MAG: adenine deaminase C-terminal domain-containing protein [Sarcina sp.]